MTAGRRVHAILYVQTRGILEGMVMGWDGKNHERADASSDWREVTCRACLIAWPSEARHA